MSPTSIVAYPNGNASLASDGNWWCGSKHGWVQEGSSHWEMNEDCMNMLFDSPEEALEYARARGWIP
jgi:hypothetical protein